MLGTALSWRWSLLQLITLTLIAASVPKKAALESTQARTRHGENTGMQQRPSPLEPGTQGGEENPQKALGSQQSRELEKKLDAEKVVEESERPARWQPVLCRRTLRPEPKQCFSMRW